MHRLFWKIFLSFWFSLILFAGASLLAASLFLERTRGQDAIESPRSRLFAYIQEAQLIATDEGIEGLRSWLEKLDRREVIPFLLIDTDGKDLLERPVSSQLTERLNRRRRSPHHMEAGRPPSRRGLVQVPGGGEYRLIPDFQAATLNRVLSRPRVTAIPVILATLVSVWCVFSWLAISQSQFSGSAVRPADSPPVSWVYVSRLPWAGAAMKLPISRVISIRWPNGCKGSLAHNNSC
jgi:two-component system sensor histidine kinase CpxA